MKQCKLKKKLRTGKNKEIKLLKIKIIKKLSNTTHMQSSMIAKIIASTQTEPSAIITSANFFNALKTVILVSISNPIFQKPIEEKDCP